MLLPSKARSKAYLFLFAACLISPAAANLEPAGDKPVDQNRVWLNENAGGEVFEISCSSDSEKDFFINSTRAAGVSGNKVTNQEIRQSEMVKSPGKYNLTVECSGTDNSSTSAQNYSSVFSASRLSLDIDSSGRGFVGGRLDNGIVWGDTSPSTSSEPVEISVSVAEDSLQGVFGQGYSDNFRFTRGLTLGRDSVKQQGSGNLLLTPEVNRYVDSAELLIQADDGDIIQQRQVKPDISEWDIQLVGGNNPGRRMDFKSALNGEYSYLLNVDKVSGQQNILAPNDFVLTVLVKSEESSGYVPVDELEGEPELENKEWLKWSEPSGQVGTHRVVLDNVKELEGLPDNQYKFLLKFNRDGYRDFVVDQVLIDKQSEFSGRVVDTTGSGVETVMKLRSREENVRVGTGKDGFYSKEINSDSFDSIVLDFYKRGKLSSDSSVVVSGPELDDNSDLGRGGSAIKFDYRSNPEVSIKGVDPVNMMAVKFGYPVSSPDEANIKFDPSNINPENLQVYECSFWNFEGSRCLGSWEEIGADGYSVNMGISPPDVHISDLTPYETPSGEKILMNAYVVGTSSDIAVRDNLKIGGQTDGRAKKGSSLTFSGFIENQKGNLVGEGIPVTVTLQNSGESKNYSGETNSNGKFTIEGNAPSATGEYEVELSSKPEIYDSLNVDYSQPLTVFTQKQIDVDAPDSFSAVKGEQKVARFEIANTGQAPVELNEIVVDGISSEFFSWKNKPSGRLEPGESVQARITVEFPEAYKDGYSSLGIKATASYGGETVESSTTVQIRARAPSTRQDSVTSNNGSDLQETETNQSLDSNSSSSPSKLVSTTGTFFQTTSNVNLVLGLVMVVMMIVAAALRTGSGGSSAKRSSRRERRERPNTVDGPMPNTGTPKPSSDTSSNTEKPSDQETDESEDENKVYVDEETGKEFDTREALELYQQTRS